ncbi:MAG: choice-of-anchor L domain-containing protein [Bacteroidetes bacterium]|nr:choice-of-anchor L domain-containing protein [Bacteroidota bacterium]
MKQLCIFSILMFCFVRTPAQLKIDTSQSADHLINQVFAGDGIRIGNITSSSNKKSIGSYQCPENKTGMASGLILSTGFATNAIGPNSSPGISSVLYPGPKKYKSDKSLVKLAMGSKVYDITYIEFDFIPLNNKVTFEYAFGSEEYKEYVGSPFNDVFGFFVTGGPMNQKNEALLPNDKKFVAINNINQKLNKQLYIDNDPFVNTYLFKSKNMGKETEHAKSGAAKTNIKPTLGGRQNVQVTDSSSMAGKAQDTALYYKATGKKYLNENILKIFQYDGFTKKMKAQFYVVPYAKYHIKICIGDVDDQSFDSGVFLEAHSFSSVKDSTQKGFKNYKDLSATFPFDSIMKYQKVIVRTDNLNEPAHTELYEKTTVHFATNETTIPDTCTESLDELALILANNPKVQLNISGYGDHGGNINKNKFLCEQRAESVILYISKQGIYRERMHYTGMPAQHAVKGRTPKNTTPLPLTDVLVLEIKPLE